MKLLTTPTQFELTKSRGILEFECEYCNEPFHSDKHSYYAALNPNHVRTLNYCSPKCKRFAEGTRIKCSCSECGNELERTRSQFEKTQNHFCNSSCSAQYYNAKRVKKLYANFPLSSCKNCPKTVNSRGSVYCSTTCSFDYKRKIKVQEFLEGKINSATSIKKYLLLTRNHECQVCLQTTWMNKPIPLETDHIDGNSENNFPINLRLICPNCHAQTETYKAKNIGQGRHKRRLRYQDGKSY